MPAIVVIGAHWGDEGKGKIVDLLAQEADVIVRYSGGDNAGHTVINDHGSFGLHLVPSGIFCPRASCVIANGVVVNPESLLNEMQALEAKGVDTRRIIISDKAHMVLPHHLLMDGMEEASRGDVAIGTTRRGIGPTYADRASRNGIRMGDLLSPDFLRARLGVSLQSKNEQLKAHGITPPSFEDVWARCRNYAEKLGPYIHQTELLINDALDEGKKVIFEGAQGTLLDVQFGTYPYVTSSDTTASGVYTGAGLRPRALDTVIAVFKAYTTRVGTGPMPTELLDETGELIRKRAHEFGTTTGRPRRCGWFDAVAGRYCVRVNGVTAGALTRLDVLDDFATIKVCTAYRFEGKTLDTFPGNEGVLARCEPVYEELPGWRKPTAHLRRFDDLPREAKAYIHRLESLLGCTMSLISVGPRREETITAKPII
jgi:adenylosuccinate synthase